MNVNWGQCSLGRDSLGPFSLKKIRITIDTGSVSIFTSPSISGQKGKGQFRAC